jgi:hypothetical protein
VSRWYAPLDRECPEVEHFMAALWSDAMTTASGVGDEIAEDFAISHRAKCERCQRYGAANVEVR